MHQSQQQVIGGQDSGQVGACVKQLGMLQTPEKGKAKQYLKVFPLDIVCKSSPNSGKLVLEEQRGYS